MVPVVYDDADDDSALDLNSDDTPSEDFGIGGQQSWIPAELMRPRNRRRGRACRGWSPLFGRVLLRHVVCGGTPAVHHVDNAASIPDDVLAGCGKRSEVRPGNPAGRRDPGPSRVSGHRQPPQPLPGLREQVAVLVFTERGRHSHRADQRIRQPQQRLVSRPPVPVRPRRVVGEPPRGPVTSRLGSPACSASSSSCTGPAPRRV